MYPVRSLICIFAGLLILSGCAALPRTGDPDTAAVEVSLYRHPGAHQQAIYEYILYAVFRAQGNADEARRHLERSVQATQEPTADALVELGTLVARQGDFSEAIPLLQQAVRIAPERIDLLELLAFAHMNRPDLLRARDALLRAVELGETNTEYFLLCARLLHKLEQSGRALELLEELTRLHTDVVPGYILAARIQLDTGEPALALDWLDRAREMLGRTTTEIWELRARALLQTAREADFLREFRQFIERPELPNGAPSAISGVLEDLYAREQYDLLEAALQSLRAGHPAEWVDNFCAISAYTRAAYDRALQCYASLDAQADLRALARRLVLRRALGDLQADRQLRELLRAPESRSAVRAVVNAYLLADQQAQRPDRMRELGQLMQQTASDTRERVVIGADLEEMLGHPERKEQMLRDLYASDPRISNALILAEHLYNQGRFAAIDRLLSPLVDSEQAGDHLWNFLGYTLVEQRMDVKRGGELIRRAVEQQSTSPYYLDSLAWFYYQSGDYQNALVHIRRALQEKPAGGNDSEIAVLYEHAGDIARKAGDPWLGVSWYVRAQEIEPSAERRRKIIELREQLDSGPVH